MNLIGTVTKKPFMIREIFISEWTLSLRHQHITHGFQGQEKEHNLLEEKKLKRSVQGKY